MRLWRIPFFCMLLLVVFPARGSAQVACSVEGIVLEEGTDRPLKGVKVSVESMQNWSYTDAEGRFSLLFADTGHYHLVPTLSGFAYSRPSRLKATVAGAWIDVSAGQKIQDIHLKMVRGAVITGALVDKDGTPIFGNHGSAALLRYRYDDEGNKVLVSAPGATQPGVSGSFTYLNDRGQFRLFGIPPGDYFLKVAAQGVNPAFYPGSTNESKAAPIHVNGGDEIRVGTLTVPFASDRPKMRLHIIDASGRSTDSSITFGAGTESIFFGSFQSSSQRVSRFSMQRQANESLGANSDVTIRRDAHVTTNIQLEDELGKLEPVTLGRAGGIQCEMKSDVSSGWIFTSDCDSDTPSGIYQLRFSEMARDVFVLSVEANGEKSSDGKFHVAGDTQINVLLTKVSSNVKGLVKSSDGEILSDAVVALMPDGAGLPILSVVSAIDGTYDLRGLPPGDYHLFAWSELEGAAYRNSEFMKAYDGKGKALHVEKNVHLSMELTVLD